MNLLQALLMGWLTTAMAATPQIKVSPKLQCQIDLMTQEQAGKVTPLDLLHNVLPEITRGSTIRGSAGTFSEIQTLILQSGAKPDTAARATFAMMRLLDANKGKDTALGNTALRLNQLQNDDKALIICVLSQGCKLKAGGAMHLAINGVVFDIVPFRDPDGSLIFDPNSDKTGWWSGAVSDKEMPESPPRYIIMNGGVDYLSYSFLTKFIHEATHFADFELIADWLRANRSLLETRQLPDDLFSTYVRFGSGSKFQVDEGFMRIFLESRAYSAEVAGFANLSPDYKQLERIQREHAMEDIAHFGATTQFVATALNLTIDNVFEVGERLGRTMTATIRQAGKNAI